MRAERSLVHLQIAPAIIRRWLLLLLLFSDL